MHARKPRRTAAQSADLPRAPENDPINRELCEPDSETNPIVVNGRNHREPRERIDDERGAQRKYPNSPKPPNGKRGRRLGAGALLSVFVRINSKPLMVIVLFRKL